MPKLYDMWTELKIWLELHTDEYQFSEVLDKMDELESEYE